MIFNRIYNDSLGSILGLISLWLLELSYNFEVSVLVLELVDLGFVREALILKNWNILDLFG